MSDATESALYQSMLAQGDSKDSKSTTLSQLNQTPAEFPTLFLQNEPGLLPERGGTSRYVGGREQRRTYKGHATMYKRRA